MPNASKPTQSADADHALATITARFRNEISVLAHFFLFALSLLAAFGLAYNFHGIQTWLITLYLPMLALALPIKGIVFWWLGLFRGSWRYVGLRDLIDILVGAQISSFGFVLVWFMLETVWRSQFNRPFFDDRVPFAQSVFLIDWAATMNFVAAARVLVRYYFEFKAAEDNSALNRVLVVGAPRYVEQLIREILRTPQLNYDIVGILDTSGAKLKHRIHGVEIVGRADDIAAACQRLAVEEIFIAMPEAKPRELREVIDHCKGNSLRFRTVPALTALIEGRVQVSQLRPVDIEDLLGRDPVQLDLDAIGAELSGKRIVVTGAGGSIGSEMCRQIARFAPEKLLLIEQAENNLFEIHRELIAKHPDLDIQPIVADICDHTRIQTLFDKQRPSTVFHAAAHKHVPMMECNPGEAIKNNVVGTRTIAMAAAETGVSKMVMISTDKAVNPTSIMGCSKRVAEMFVQQYGKRCSVQFVTVRFGNVLGSSGSVIPIFRRQITEGGPVTVTHPDMTRYFMTIPEAAQLVLQAGTMGNGGEVYVLDMGEPVRIIDLATNMITLSGLRIGEDIEIRITGTRPGEKLFEELLIDGENVSATSHPKIGIWTSRAAEDWDQLQQNIQKLVQLADSGSTDSIRAQLHGMVPEYAPAEGGQRPDSRAAPVAARPA